MIDLLEIKISEARSALSKESREAIDNVNWKLTIQEMNKRYSPEQLENLETETELLLCGILNPEDYPKELETRMRITKEESELIINEMDRLVFKKIQEELEKRINNKEEIPLPPYAKVITNDQLSINNEEKIPVAPEIPKPTEIATENISIPIDTTDTPKNIIEDKLKGPTASDQTVSDYSTPKINDPYREAF